MEASNKMLSTQRKTAEAIAEAEKFRVKNLEVNNLEKSKNKQNINPFSQTINGNNMDEQESIEQIDLDRNIQHSLEVRDEIRENFSELKIYLEAGKSAIKIRIDRDYKLTTKSNITLWMDYLESEITFKNLLDFIDSKVLSPKNVYEETILRRKGKARDIIINHLDGDNHKKILDMKDLKTILQK